MKKLIFVFGFFVCCNYISLGQAVKCKTFIQGAYQSGSLMKTSLTGLIPGTQPYNVDPWNYPGTESLNSIPANMVDWVLVELRNSADPTMIISRRAALLLSDGEIADTNLAKSVNFPGVPSGNYYLCIYHRNHFPVLSENPIPVPNLTSYNFSDTLNFPPYGGGYRALIELEPGIYGMIAGDVNKDGTIKYSGPANDRGPVLQYIVNQSGSSSITTTVSGYRDEDINMDSIIKYSGPGNDPSLIIQNLVGLTGSTSITSVYNSIVPSGMLAFQCGDTLTDQRDGKKYATVQIGTQCWMAENLAYLPSVSPSSAESDTLPYYYVYDYQGTDVNAAKATSNYQTYGTLYNWPAAMAGEASSNNVPSGVQGICPGGWHLPGDEEWKILEGAVDSQYGYPDPEWDVTGYRGTDAGENLKEAGTTHWNSPNSGATNNSGFTALPGGSRYYDGTFRYLGGYARFWSSTEYNSTNAWLRFLGYDYANVYRSDYYNELGFSVRCLKDTCTQPTQSDAGQDSLNIVGDSIALWGNIPNNGFGLWTIYIGTGGSFSDSTNPTSIFYGLPGNTYYLVWTISNNYGSSSDTVIISFASQGIVCENPIVDSRDGNSYNTILIGNQCWMAENLAYLPSVSPSSAGSFTTPYYYVYDYQGTDVSAAKATPNYHTYGVLYNWSAAMAGDTSSNNVPSGVRGACPASWHLPGDEEWKILEGEVDSLYGYPNSVWDGTGWRGADAGGNLKETGTTHWYSTNIGVTNSSGFTALPGGDRDGWFYDLGDYAYFWSSTEGSSTTAWYRLLEYYETGVYRYNFSKKSGFSVRCLKDTCMQPTQSDAGPDSLGIIADSIVLMANTPVDGQGLWTVFSGSGGNFVNSTNPTTLFYGLPAHTYYLVWTISNTCGSSSDTVIIRFAYYNCGVILDSRDGNSYNTVQIGTQCWMAENLAYLPSVSPSDSGSYSTPYYYVYDYQGTSVSAAKSTTNYQTYGTLYNWPAAMAGDTSSNSVPSGVQGICPSGWHLPSNAEWTLLADSLGGSNVAGGEMKEIGTIYWNSPNTGATNSSGFTALPGGFRGGFFGTFLKMGTNSQFWSSVENPYWEAWQFALSSDSPMLYQSSVYKIYGVSVRCLKDCTSPTQSNAGPDSLNITGDSITLIANTPINGQGLWTIAIGYGGSFADSTNSTSMFYGLPAYTYYLVWTISNNCGSSSDTVIIAFATGKPNCGIITDVRDGSTYNTVVIGTQCWMAENLTYLPFVSPSSAGSDTIPYYYVFDYQGIDVNAAKATSNYQTYGVLYNWAAAMAGEASSNSVPSGVKGVCPPGWHLPGDEEWNILEGEVDSQYGYPNSQWDGYGCLGFDAGGNLKETGTIHWFSPNIGATNSSGFSALPGGLREGYIGSFGYLNNAAIFWSSSETSSSSSSAWIRDISYSLACVDRRFDFKGRGFSVRCLKDTCTQPTQSDAGPDSLNISGDSIALMGNIPLVGQGLWTIFSGTSGSLSDSTNPTSMFYGLPDSTYHLIWTISNNCGSSSDTVIISFASQGFTCGGNLIDTRDGNNYTTVLIGSQCWMAENLAYLPTISPSSAGSITTPYYYVYDYEGSDVPAAKSTNNYQNYGVLYNWPAAMDGEASSNNVPSGVQGICPAGWHLPSDEEWKILEGSVDSQYGYPDPEWDGTGYRGTDAGGNLKETGTTHWNSPNTGVTNSSGFTALPGGYRYNFGSFYYLGNTAYFWCSSEISSNLAWRRYLSYNKVDVARSFDYKETGSSVRCLKDICAQPTQSDAGADLYNIQVDSTTLLANAPQIGQGIWTIASGTGGSFSDPTNPTSIFYGVPPNTYNLVWTISNNCGSSSDTVSIGFIYPNCGLITDARDGNTYTTVVIGTQCWMAENLNATQYPDGTPIPLVMDDIAWGNLGDNNTDDAYCIINNNSGGEADTYGALYTWAAAMGGNAVSSSSNPSGVQGICPTGWHLPSNAEWTQLTDYLGGESVAGGKLKAISLWFSPNTGATNETGFTGLPGGDRSSSTGSFGEFENGGYWWGSTEEDNYTVWRRRLYYTGTNVHRANGNKSGGYSVRCVLD